MYFEVNKKDISKRVGSKFDFKFIFKTSRLIVETVIERTLCFRRVLGGILM